MNPLAPPGVSAVEAVRLSRSSGGVHAIERPSYAAESGQAYHHRRFL